MRIELGFGAGTQTVEVPDRCVLLQVPESDPAPCLTSRAEVRRSHSL